MVLVLAGCSYCASIPPALDKAQRMMHEDPAAALSELNNVDISTLADSSIMARWALLYSEALVANNLSAPTDTIVNIAISYYGSHSRPEEFLKASRLKALIMSGDGSDRLATALYLQKEKEFMLYKERAEHEQFMLWGVVLLISAAGIIIIMRQRMKRQAAERDSLIAEASCLKSQIDTSRSDIDRLQSKLHGLLENRFALIDSLCQTYYESQGTKTERKAITDKVRTEIEAVRTDSLPEMESAVNDCRDGILDKAKKEYPDIKADDYQLLVYLASGLSTRTISLLLDESVDVVYKRKSRLKSRCKEKVSTACPDIMSVF